MDQIKVPLALVFGEYQLFQRLMLSHDSMHCKTIIGRDVIDKHWL